MRARNIKPGFFSDEDLAELPYQVRLLFVGLWCCADRDGRLEDRPKRIRAEVFPYELGLDLGPLLDQLADSGHIIRYQVGGQRLIQVVHFEQHQRPHHTERRSVLPVFNGEPPVRARSRTVIHDSGFMIHDSGGDPPSENGEHPEPNGALTVKEPSQLQKRPAAALRTGYPPGWVDFARRYPPFRLTPDTGARSWFWKNITDDEKGRSLLAEVLSGLDYWLRTDQWRRNIVPNSRKFVAEGQFRKRLPGDEIRPRQQDPGPRASTVPSLSGPSAESLAEMAEMGLIWAPDDPRADGGWLRKEES